MKDRFQSVAQLISERFRDYRPTPMLTLAIGSFAWVFVVLLGLFFDWGFFAGLLVMLSGILAALIWAFDGAGRLVGGGDE